MVTGPLLASAGARVLLAGSSRTAPGSRLPPVDAVPRTLTDLGDALTSRAELDPGGLTTLLDPAGPGDLSQALNDTARQATDVMVFYYIGHGLAGPGNELHLATRATRDLGAGGARYQALPYSDVRETLSQRCRAPLVLVVLDCCFAGRAGGVTGSAADDAFDSTRWAGAYLLASAGRDGPAWAPSGHPHTAFTGELITLLRDGDPAGPPELTLDAVYRSLARTLPAKGFPRPRRQAADLGDHQVLAANAAYHPPAAPPLPGPADTGDSPYRGLTSYGPQDARFFFGRDELTATLLSRITASPDVPVVVTGPSGSGKSSVLRAGLLPALSRAPGPRPLCVVLTPGTDPVGALAHRLAGVVRGDETRLRARLDEGGSPAEGLADALRGSGAEGLVVLVDQFEELFTVCEDERQRGVYIRALTALCAASDAGTAVTVVLGLRADFFGHCARYPALVEALRSPEVVPPLTVAQLREVIERPAALSGLTLQDGLADLLLDDIGADSGGTLPLLSHVLLATWRHREGAVLTLAAYRATGGLSRALAKTADDTLTRLGPDGEDMARRVLLRMVRLGDGTEDTRRRVPLAEVLPDGEEGHAAKVLAAFVDSRLVTAGTGTAEIAHEALLRHWPRLRAWIDAGRAGLLVRQRLEDAATAWDREGRHPAMLDRGPRLEAAAAWVRDTAGRELSPLAHEFHQAGLRARDTDVLATRRRARIRGQVIATLAVLLALTLGLGALAETARRRADAERDTALAKNVATRATELRRSDPVTAMRLSVAAHSISASAETDSALFGSLTQPELSVSRPPGGRVTYSADMRVMTVMNQEGTHLYEAGGRRLATLAGVPADQVVSAVPGTDGRTVLLGFLDTMGRYTVWDTRTGRRTDDLPGRLPRFADDGRSRIADTGIEERVLPGPDFTPVAGMPTGGRADVSPRGDLAAVYTDDGYVELWRLWPRRERVARLGAGGRGAARRGLVLRDMTLSADGRRVALAAAQDGVLVLDARRPADPRTAPVGGEGEAYAMELAVFSGNGAVLATADGFSVQLRDPVTLEVLARFSYPGFEPISLAFGPGDRVLMMGDTNGTVRVVDVAALTSPPVLGGEAPSVGARYSADGAVLATMTAGAVTFWDHRVGRRLGTVPGPWETEWRSLDRTNVVVPAMAFSPDGRTLAVPRSDTAVALIDVATARVRDVIEVPVEGEYPVELLALAFNPVDAGTLAISMSDNRVRLWDVVSHREKRTMTSDVVITTMVWSPDGKVLALGHPSSTRLWRPAAGDTSLPFQQEASSEPLAFSRDGARLAVRGENDCSCENQIAAEVDARVWLWDPATRLPVYPPLAGHEDTAVAAAFSPDGKLLATAGADATVRLWDTRTHRPVGEPVTGFTGAVLAVTFDDGGRTVSAVDARGTARTVPVSPGRLLPAVCARAGGGLSERDWDALIPDLPYRPTCLRP
ncbi:caspase family protein [Sphaerisporangium sp. B11E5]|uniref:caspase, EACC1-associated type n=1 Tax=Sphaerisporangium sp. B11E5 TaxID=3153563 RepID=UPI00325DBFAF